MLGCLVFHSRPAQTQKGWRTPVSYDGKGFPDLVAVSQRNGAVIFIECKSDKGRFSPEQNRWRSLLEFAASMSPHLHYMESRPKHFPLTVNRLQDIL